VQGGVPNNVANRSRCAVCVSHHAECLLPVKRIRLNVAILACDIDLKEPHTSPKISNSQHHGFLHVLNNATYDCSYSGAHHTTLPVQFHRSFPVDYPSIVLHTSAFGQFLRGALLKPSATQTRCGRRRRFTTFRWWAHLEG
jgi:hypothetical protein